MISDDLVGLFAMLNVDQYSLIVLTCVGWSPNTDNLISERTLVERKVVKVYLACWRCEVSLLVSHGHPIIHSITPSPPGGFVLRVFNHQPQGGAVQPRITAENIFS